MNKINLEFCNSYPKIKPLAKYLFLAGDIGTISNKYDSYCANNWEKTFYVLGNHEFYQNNEFAHKKNFEELEMEYKEIFVQNLKMYIY